MDLWMMWHEFVRKTKLELWMSSKNYYRAQFRYQESKLAQMVQENCYGIAQQKKLTGYSRLVDMIIRFNITRNQVLLQENLN